MTAPDGGPAEGETTEALVVPAPDEGMVLIVLREGDRYSFMPCPRELLEDTESAWPTLQEVFDKCGKYLSQPENYAEQRRDHGTVPYDPT